MSLLTPLGLLGLLGIVALIIIYIIRPNYQQKYVSSTFVWKLALKRKRKRIPVSKLRNFLLILCQILILLSLTMALTTPSKELEVSVDAVEVVAIVDASASMKTKNSDGVSRFERALEKVRPLADEAFDNGGFVSLMFAGETNYYVVEKITSENREMLYNAIDDAIYFDQCTYGKSDLDSAIILSQEVLETNPSTQIYVYSDIDYAYVPKNDVHYERIYDLAENNLAILDAYAERVNNYYSFHIDVASYGKDSEISMNIMINGANTNDTNPTGVSVKLSDVKVSCVDSVVNSLVICSDKIYTDDDRVIAEAKGVKYLNMKDCQSDSGVIDVISFDSINVSINVQGEIDSYEHDNSFYIYGGQREKLKIQYASTSPNIFMQTAIPIVGNVLSEYWDVRFEEKKLPQSNAQEGEDYSIEGYDIYIFEHKMPSVLPTDGIVILLDPHYGDNIADAGFRVVNYNDSVNNREVPLVVKESHNLIADVKVTDITATLFINIDFYSDEYKVIAEVNGCPAIAIREPKTSADERTAPIILMAMNVHRSTFVGMPDFMFFWMNIFEYYLPPTVKSHAFEVYEKIELNARSDELVVKDLADGGNIFSETFTTFPAQVVFDTPGVYTLSQKTYANKDITDTIYVRCPMAESNIFEKRDALMAPYREQVVENKFKDLLFYFALALVAILLLEWFLQARDNM